MLLNCGVGEDCWEFLGLQGDPSSQSWRKSVLNIHWKDWCWSWNSNTLATWFEELTHWKTPWYWERLKAGGEGNDRGWDGWMASPTWWTWVWVSSRSWWGTGKGGVLQSKDLDMTERLNWTDNNSSFLVVRGQAHGEGAGVGLHPPFSAPLPSASEPPLFSPFVSVALSSPIA